MELNDFLRALHERYGTAPLEVDDEGCCSLRLDDVDADLFPAGGTGRILALSGVAQLPDAEAGELAERLLAANLEFPDSRTAFALDAEAGAVVLQTLMEGDDPDSLALQLLSHAGLVRRWRSHIVQHVPAGQAPGGHDQESDRCTEFVPDSWMPV